MKPFAWSHTALDSFENCPKQYYETKVVKRWDQGTTQEMQWGRDVHKAFENYLLHLTPLPPDLATHRDFLDRFRHQPGMLAGEERIALNERFEPCGYFDKAPKSPTWWRGQVDARKRDLNRGFSHILDHKTGKVKTDFTQLKQFAIHEFVANPGVHMVKVEFYWTQIKAANGETYTRDQLPGLIRELIPRLHRFADAFAANAFPPKPSGLCRGWCPVTDCEFWTPKRPR